MARILLIDNSTQLPLLLAQRLSALGFAVIEHAADGLSLADLPVTHRADLIVYSGDPDHLAERDRIAALLPPEGHLPLLVITECDTPRDRQQSSVCYLAPPFSDRELRNTLQLALALNKAAQSTHELNAFFSIAIDMFCILDFNGYFKRLNPAWQRVLGFSATELMSMPFIEFVHLEDRPRTLAQNAAVRAGEEASGFENRYLHKDGSFRWLRWNARPQTVDGKIYSVARDITARKQVEDERAAAVRTLEASMAEVKSLRDILPICMYCRNVRDDENYWQSVESYVSRHTATRFSHGICPSCMESEVEPQLRSLEES